GSPKEVVSVSNMGMSKRGPIIEGRDQLLLEFTDGSVCMSEGQKLSYSTQIHLVCSRGASLNICEDAPGCGPGMGGCELENSHPVSPVGVEKTLKYSTDGVLQLTYKGVLDGPT
ncbi:hypothetical protein GOODEAATRI_033188, partial [Goodea atripinnis]